MSTRTRGRRERARPVALLVLGVAASLGLASSVAAGPPPPTSTISAAEAARAGAGVSVVHHPLPGGDLLEIRAPVDPARVARSTLHDAAETARRDALRLLDASASGYVALADDIADPAGGLRIVDTGGMQVHVAMPGVLGAAFGPGQGWLAAVDGSGHLWRITVTSGAADRIADGPFAGTLDVAPDGSLLAVELSSVEAPFASNLVRVDPESGATRSLAGDELGLVFALRALPDGSVAAVTHRPGSGMDLVRIENRRVTAQAALDADAMDPTLSADGTAVAYALAGDGAYLLQRGGHGPVRLGDGALPRIAPDATSVAVLRGASELVVTADGMVLETLLSGLVAWARCDGRCPA